MSLLMDALRQAETQQEQEKQASTESAAEQTQSADTPDMQLEPLNAATQLVEELQTETDAFAVNTKSETADADTPPDQTKTAAALTEPATAWQKKALYFLSGFVTIILIVGAYYLWRNDQTVIPVTPHTVTLIDAPAPDTNHRPVAELLPVPSATNSKAAEAFVPAAPIPTTPPRPGEHTVSTTDTPDPAFSQPAQRIEIHKSRRIRAVHPLVQKAYHAYQQQNYTEAEQLYRKVLKRNQGNRDAALGLAAIAMHQGNLRIARYYYQRVLKANPADTIAQIALTSLDNTPDNLQETSQLKHWLQGDRNNAQLHFALGNRYASAGQWKEAQQAYLEAQRIDPNHPDYTFNLAISLDQLGLQKQALEYYLNARDLADSHTALFSATQLGKRIRQLQQGQGATP